MSVRTHPVKVDDYEQVGGQHGGLHRHSGEVTVSGNVTVQSGIYLASGIQVGISGQHVYVESGVHVVIPPIQVASGLGVLISGQHVFVESGVWLASGIYVVTAAASGTYQASGIGVIINSGVGVTVQSGLNIIPQSGVYTASGIYVVAAVQSGVGVLISGQHVFVESGAYVVAGTTSGTYQASGVGVIIDSGVGVTVQSGIGVLISGQHVFVESGVFAVIQSGIYTIGGFESGAYFASGIGMVVQSGVGVLISGQHVFVESGVWTIGGFTSGSYIASGIGVQTQSGLSVIPQSGIYLASGIYQASGIGVTIQSGTGVLISGQHVFVESGVYIHSGVILGSGGNIVASVSGDIVGITGTLNITGTVAVLSGVFVASGIGVLISGQHVYVESGIWLTSGVGVVIDSGVGVTVASGLGVQLESGAWLASGIYVVAAVQSGVGVLISGQHVFVESGVWLASGIYVVATAASGTYTASGVGVTVQSGIGVLVSGQWLEVHILSGEITIVSGDVRARISGDHVYVESGVWLASGIYVTATAASGTYQASGVGVLINSGVGVTVQSGVFVGVSGQHVYVESGAWLASGIYVVAAAASGTYTASGVGVTVQSGVGVLISGQQVVLQSGSIVKVSGEFIPIGGMDYIQSGTAAMHSGQYRMATTMKGLESAVANWEGFAQEARLFTGADAKHVRFHDIFDATTLDPIKWSIEAVGAVTVADGYADLYDVASPCEIMSIKQFLYGVLSLRVQSDNYAGVSFGFYSAYTQGTGREDIEVNIGTVTVDSPSGSTVETISPALVNGTWYSIDIVWTPNYVQVWVDSVLRHTVTTNIPNSPLRIWAQTMDNVHLLIDSVSLKPYGDIPLTVKGAVPVAGMNLSGQYVPIAVKASGELILASGAWLASGIYVVAAAASGSYHASGVGVIINSGVGVTVQSGVFVGVSGQHIYVESGVWLASGAYVVAGAASGSYHASGVGVTVQSGVFVGVSGQHIYVESGVWLASGAYVVAGAASGSYHASGVGVIINSGVGVTVQSGITLMSGVINQAWISGIIIASGTLIPDVASGIIINNSGNPVPIGAISGGTMLWSAVCISVIVKALAKNSSDIYIGAGGAGNQPYSGCGFVLEPGEAINIDVENIGFIRGCAAISGDKLTYLAIV